jgi:hypothetical protein
MAFTVGSLTLACIGHVGRNVDQADDMRVRAGLRDDRATVAMADKDAGAILLSEHTFGCHNIIRERREWFLNQSDFIAILNKDLVNRFPARPIDPGAMYQNDVVYRLSRRLRD